MDKNLINLVLNYCLYKKNYQTTEISSFLSLRRNYENCYMIIVFENCFLFSAINLTKFAERFTEKIEIEVSSK